MTAMHLSITNYAMIADGLRGWDVETFARFIKLSNAHASRSFPKRNTRVAEGNESNNLPNWPNDAAPPGRLRLSTPPLP